MENTTRFLRQAGAFGRRRALSALSHDIVCEHDLNGRILHVNAAAARAIEYRAAELRTMNVRDVLHPAARGDFEIYLRTLEAEGTAEGLMVVRTRSGQRRIWQYRKALRRTRANRSVVLALAHDVTERENALDALRRSERHFRTIIESASDMILIVEPVGDITYHSPATERLLGYSAEEIDGRHFTTFVHADDEPRIRDFFRTLADESPSLDVRIRHRDGSWRWFSVVASTVRKPGGVSALVVNGRDITDRRLLEAQLEQAKRLTSLGHLTATVAHEFNNVLMGMQPFADLMQRPGVSPELVAKGATHIANSIARGKRVALDMLRFTRPAQPATAPLSLDEWWTSLRAELQATLGSRITLTSSFGEPLTVLADGGQIAQVLSNLVSNARDAMPHGGTVSVCTRHPSPGESFAFGVVPNPENFAQISITDTGCGMAEDVLRHAFDPLFTTKQIGGTGLGLAVAHQVMAKHNGYVFAESEPGLGTTFHLFLPLVARVEEAATREDAQPMLRTKRVLVVDDETLIGEGLAEALRDCGIEATAVPTGGEAVDAARSMRAEAAVVDIWLPDIDGIEVGMRLRAFDPTLKIVFASGHGSASHALERCAPATFLQKPFAIHELLNAISSLENDNPTPVQE
ncbi:MAG TPA: PAS domain S-box protein [Thermoanaerobaculia bacterium]|nr:PAS domain S-box protein [Thermoanaerobaculia bacterium]